MRGLPTCGRRRIPPSRKPSHGLEFNSFDVSYESPKLCVQLCKDIIDRDGGDDLLALVAAGPLEGVLVNHGPIIIEEVEERAARDPRFRHLLGGVWKNAMADEIWDRVCKAREAVW